MNFKFGMLLGLDAKMDGIEDEHLWASYRVPGGALSKWFPLSKS